MKALLSLQILALTLIPVLSGVAPKDGSLMINPAALLGIEESVTPEFMAGTWKYSDEFFRWGVTDKDKGRIRPFRGTAFMSLNKDGTLKMFNFFRPKAGRWELTRAGILIHDPRHPERGSQVLPIRKRDKDRIWVLLPFTGGATGIGMTRVSEEEFLRASEKPELNAPKRYRTIRRQSGFPKLDLESPDVVVEKPLSQETIWGDTDNSF
jgi:hypothetical protein